MDTVQLNQSLTFLAYATAIIVIIAGLMLTKVFYDLSVLTKNLNETVMIIKKELEPTLINVRKSVEIISDIVIKADAGVKKVKDFIGRTPLKLFGKLTLFTGKAAKGFFAGLGSAFKFFNKKH